MINRRRAITILAGAAVLPGQVLGAGSEIYQWKGIALGAEARIILDHPDAKALVSLAVTEIHRLENIFSLYQPDSQLSRLNRDGVLENPAFEMVELLSICSEINARSNGAFDPTVQALWALYARAFSKGAKPAPAQIKRAKSVTGWDHVRYSAAKISFARKGVMLTLNGIAQGYIADKVAGIFRTNGVSNVMVNTGEIIAMGSAPDGGDWQVKLGERTGPGVSLQNAAIATSRPLGTVFDTASTSGHILDPRTGYPGAMWSQVSVISRSAAQADGLSTAFCLMNRGEIDAAKDGHQVLLR